MRSRLGRVSTWWAASAMISTRRVLRRRVSSPAMSEMAAVSIAVRGQSAFTATPCARNSSAIPSTHRLMPYFAIVYATCGANQRGFRLSGGEIVSTCGLADRSRCGRQCCVARYVPRAFTWCIRSKRRIGVSSVPVR